MTAYQAGWDWIDRIIPVGGTTEQDEVLHELFDQIAGDGDIQVDVLVPALESLEENDARRMTFALPGERKAMRQRSPGRG